jgi:hypothetical protein
MVTSDLGIDLGLKLTDVIFWQMIRQFGMLFKKEKGK